MIRTSTFCHGDDTESFSLLFDIETYLRTIVRWEMRGRNPKDWLGLLPAEIKGEAKNRYDQEQATAYLDIRHSGLLSYLTLSELKDLIVGPLWHVFRSGWPPKDILQSEFKKLIAIRNKVAHFRPLTERDRRVVNRFAEDLVEWTGQYRRLRARQDVVCLVGGDSEDVFKKRKCRKIAEFWNELRTDQTADSYQVSLSFVGHHIACTATVKGGSIDPNVFLSFLERYEGSLTFCRLGDLGEKLTCYIPAGIEEQEIIRTFKAMISILGRGIDGLSSDEVRSRFQFAQREGIIAWSIDLPPEFRI